MAELLSLVGALTIVSLLLLPTILLYYSVFKSSAPPPLRRRGGSNNNGQQRLPPSPRGLPLVGHLHLLGSLPHRSLRSMALKHGPVVLLRLGRVPAVVVSSSAGAEEAMRTRDLAFASRPASAMAGRLLYGCRDVAFAPYGEYWRQARRVCVAHLLSARRTGSSSFRRVRHQEAERLVDAVSHRSDVGSDLGELVVAYANNIVSRAAFGDESSRRLYEDDRHRGRELRRVLADFQELLATEPLGELLPWLAWVDSLTGLHRKAKRTFHALDAVLQKVIDDHRLRRRRGPPAQDDSDGDHRDFVDVLLDVNDKEDYGIRLSTDEIKAIILDMFAAGTDTTTTVIEWAMAELVTHPCAMRRLQAELRTTFAATSTSLLLTEVEDHLDGKLPYLRCVIKETLRLHAPVPLLVPRETTEDTELLGYHVPARTRVVINAWAIGRDAAAWGHDAGEFVPERFLISSSSGSNAGEVDYRGQSFELIPFGAGRRGCPGIGFAEQTIAVALASLLYHFDWEPVVALDMTEKNGIGVHIKAGLPLRAKPWRLDSPDQAY